MRIIYKCGHLGLEALACARKLYLVIVKLYVIKYTYHTYILYLYRLCERFRDACVAKVETALYSLLTYIFPVIFGMIIMSTICSESCEILIIIKNIRNI